MNIFSSLLMLLVATLAQAHSNSEVEVNETQVESRSLFSNLPWPRTKNHITKELHHQEAREREAGMTHFNTASPFQTFTTGPNDTGPKDAEIPPRRTNEASNLDSIRRHLQQRAKNTTTPPSVHSASPDDELDEVIRILKQRAANERPSTLPPVTSTPTSGTRLHGATRILQQRVIKNVPTPSSVHSASPDDELDEVIRILQQRAANERPSTLPPVTPNPTTGTRLHGATRILQQRVIKNEPTPPPVRTTTSVVHILPKSQFTSNTLTTSAAYDLDNADEVETCWTQGLKGECVRYYLCRNETIVTDGFNTIDMRLGAATECKAFLDECCLPSDRTTPTTPPEPKKGCGWRNPDGVGLRVTGGVAGETNYGEFPWMVAVLKDFENTGLFAYAGGGSLIHPSIVLTAAHAVDAVDTAKSLHVRAGEWDTHTKSEQYPYQERDVAELVLHPHYQRNNSWNNIALLFLSSPVAPAPHIGVVCLARAGTVVASDASCFASGWGKDKFDGAGRYQAILKRVEVPAVDHARCEALLRRTRLGRHFRLHSSFMCAGGRGQDTCTGDRGSPLVCPTESAGRYEQRGVVAWGIGCGGAAPGVHADVAALRGWLDAEVARRGHDPAVYTAG